MDKQQIKRIIAREGLIILSIIAFSIVIVLIGVHLSNYSLIDLGWFFPFIAYPLYLIFRFIIWAIKTLSNQSKN